MLNGLGRWDFDAEFKNIYLMPAEQFKSLHRHARVKVLLNCSGARFFAKLRKNLAPEQFKNLHRHARVKVLLSCSAGIKLNGGSYVRA